MNELQKIRKKLEEKYGPSFKTSFESCDLCYEDYLIRMTVFKSDASLKNIYTVNLYDSNNDLLLERQLDDPGEIIPTVKEGLKKLRYKK